MEISVISVALLAAVFAMRPDYFLPGSFATRNAEDHPSESMFAVSYTEHGPTDVLTYKKKYPRPKPMADELLVAVSAASINPCDFKFRRNPVPSFVVPKPKIPGEDISGVVVEAPEVGR